MRIELTTTAVATVSAMPKIKIPMITSRPPVPVAITKIPTGDQRQRRDALAT